MAGGDASPWLRSPTAPQKVEGEGVVSWQGRDELRSLPSHRLSWGACRVRHLPLPGTAFGAFSGRGRGKCDVMRHTEAEPSSPAPEAWLEISAQFPSSYSPMSNWGESNPTGSFHLPNRPRDPRAGTHKPLEQGLASGRHT